MIRAPGKWFCWRAVSNKKAAQRLFTPESGVLMLQEARLADQFGIPNALRFEDTPNGLVRAAISTPAAEAELYLHGAHLTHWAPLGHRPVLYLSPRSLFAPGKAIRGGVPVIFPWFGPRADGKPGPAHGFARTMEWTLEETRPLNGGAVEIALALSPGAITRDFGYDGFSARLRLTVGPELEIE